MISTNLRHSLKSHYPAIMTLVLGLVCAVVVAASVHQWDKKLQKIELESGIKTIDVLVESKLDLLMNIIDNITDEISINQIQSRKNIQQEIESLFSKYAFESLAWVPLISNEIKKEFELRHKGVGDYDFMLREINEHKVLLPASEREQYFPVVAYHDQENYSYMLGLDMITVERFKPIIEQAMLRKKLLVSEPYKISLRGEEKLLINFVYPHYLKTDDQSNSLSFVMGAIRLDKIIGELFSKINLVNYDIQMTSDGKDKNILYSSFPTAIKGAFSQSREFSYEKKINLANQVISIFFRTNLQQAFGYTWHVWFALGLGFLITSILCFHLLRIETLVDNRTIELAKLTNDAQASNVAKSMFLSNMSHEIRTPLTAIIGFAQMLSEMSIKHKLSDEIHLHANRIYRNGEHLLTLINDILDFSKIEADKIEFERIDFTLPKMIEDIRSTLAMQASNKSIRFLVDYIYPIPLNLTGDPTRIKQIMINLCSNAIKFTDSGYVQLLIKYNQKKQQLDFIVTDTGIGIPLKVQKKIFKPFSQADESTTRGYGGTGLGLCICKQLTEDMGGAIELKSEIDMGSIFHGWINIGMTENSRFIQNHSDIQKAICHTETKSEMPTPVLQGYVLVAEDWEDNQQLIGLFLKQLNLQYTVVSNGKEAVEVALDTDPDLILMDIQMPVMDGMKAVEELRHQGFTNPIIALTANVMKDEIRQYMQIGFNDCLSKPINRVKFINALQEYFTKKPQEDETADQYEESDTFKKLVKDFQKKLPEMYNKILSESTSENYNELKKSIHALKGMGGSFGYPIITEQCIEIEVLLINKQYATAYKLIQKMGKLSRQISSGNIEPTFDDDVLSS